jgi:lysophospholipase L1-like esterase
LKENNNIKLLVIGDSIGQSDGSTSEKKKWYNQFGNYLTKTYNVNISTELLTTPISTIFSGWADYFINKTPNTDMAFICFGQNDQYVHDINQFSSIYESLIRTIKSKNPNAEIVLILESPLMDSKNLAQVSQYTNVIKNLSTKYNTPVLDTISAFKISKKKYTDLTTNDKVTPNDSGYDIYSKTLINLFKERNDEIKRNDLVLKPFDKRSEELFSTAKKYSTFNLITEPTLKIGFDSKELFEDKSFFMEKRPGKIIEYDLENSNIISISLVSDSESGFIKIYNDNVLLKEIDLYSPVKIRQHLLITDQLDLKKHKIKIELIANKNPVSTGNTAKILGLMTSKNP